MYNTSVYTLVNGDSNSRHVMSDISKTAKIIKRWYHSPSHRLTVNVMLNTINFLWFLLFSQCQSLRVAINKRINW